jgi:hypothetical protein
MISILCAMQNSNYKKISGLDIWDTERDAYNFTGNNPVICHPPCAQWSKLKAFAKVNIREKDLAYFCIEKVNQNGGILEHPAGSGLWKLPGIVKKNIISINQHWFGFPSQKRTWLYFSQTQPLSFPLNFDCPDKTTTQLNTKARSKQTLEFCKWLIQCIEETYSPDKSALIGLSNHPTLTQSRL